MEENILLHVPQVTHGVYGFSSKSVFWQSAGSCMHMCGPWAYRLHTGQITPVKTRPKPCKEVVRCPSAWSKGPWRGARRGARHEAAADNSGETVYQGVVGGAWRGRRSGARATKDRRYTRSSREQEPRKWARFSGCARRPTVWDGVWRKISRAQVARARSLSLSLSQRPPKPYP